MRRVLRNHSEVAHYWAAQKQNAGESNNMFFEGNVIYSYGRHFPIANIVRGSVLFTTKDYSVSTSKHKFHTRRACQHMPIIHVDNVVPDCVRDHAENMEMIKNDIIVSLEKEKHSRKYKEQHLENAATREEELFAYADLFNVDPQWTRVMDTPDKKDALARAKTAIEELQQRIKKSQERDIRKKIKAFRNGAPLTGNVTLLDGTVPLRINGHVVETGLGAVVKLSEAKALLHAVENNLPLPAQIEGYTVQGFAADKITIGCHTINIKEARCVLV